MYIHTNIHNSICKYKHAFIKDYKKLLTYIWCRDGIGLCNLIDEWTDKSYNVYQKFILKSRFNLAFSHHVIFRHFKRNFNL